MTIDRNDRRVNDAPDNRVLTVAHSENLITLLCLSPDHGKLVANRIKPEQFGSDLHQTVVRAALAYWREYQKPPGQEHIADLPAIVKVLEDRRHPHYQAMHNFIKSMFVLYENGDMNTKFVLDQLDQHERLTAFTRATMEAAELLTSQQHLALGEVQEIFSKAAKPKPKASQEPLCKLDDLDGFLHDLAEQTQREFDLGIAPLDQRGVIPTRGELMVLIALSSVGKSWFLLNVGKRAIMQGRKALYVTLEMSAAKVRRRYIQNIFAVPQTDVDLKTAVTRLRLDDDDKLVGFRSEENEAAFSLADAELKAKLAPRFAPMQGRLGNLVIKKFPAGSLTIGQLESTLDTLAMMHDFVPDILVLDYLGIVKTGGETKRLDLGRFTVELAGLAAERNIPVVTAQQINRQGVDMKVLTRAFIAEDYSAVMTADTILILNRTDVEERHKVARIWVDKGRDTKQGFGAVITQNYEHGQFAIEAAGFVNHDQVLGLLSDVPLQAGVVPLRRRRRS